MEFFIIARADEVSIKACEKLEEVLCANDWNINEQTPEIVFSIGGDGTLLDAFHKYEKQLEQVKFIGIHSGSLGFYTDWVLSEIDELITLLIAKKYEVSEFPLLEAEVIYKNKTDKYLALNEVTILNSHRTFFAEIYINDLLFETFRGTGLCASTPSGSTAYNKSLSGAVVHPSIKAFQLTEIASINNKVYRTIGSPLVLAEQHEITLKCLESAGSVFTYDQYAISNEIPHTVRLRLSKQTAKFARFKATPFWYRVKNAFI
jgi:Predicted sugar kinase